MQRVVRALEISNILFEQVYVCEFDEYDVEWFKYLKKNSSID